MATPTEDEIVELVKANRDNDNLLTALTLHYLRSPEPWDLCGGHDVCLGCSAMLCGPLVVWGGVRNCLSKINENFPEMLFVVRKENGSIRAD